MPISAYVGLPRHGKSYSVVEHVIIPALKKGRCVWTNIPLHYDVLAEDFEVVPNSFTTKEVIENENWFQEVPPKGAVIIIDELWRLWPSGMKANRALEGHLSILTEHGHMVGEDGFCTEIIFVTQDLAQIASFARSLVETTYRTVKLTAVGLEKRFRVDVYQGPVTGPNPPASNKLRSINGQTYKPEIYKYYVSQTMSDSDSHGDESKTDGRQNILKTVLVTMGSSLVMLVVVVALGVVAFRSMFHMGEAEAKAVEIAPVTIKPADQIPERPARQAEPQQVDVFKGASYYISFNRGRLPDIDYRIRFQNGDAGFTLGWNELRSLGYSMQAVSECLIIVQVNQLKYPVSCRASGGGGSGLVNFDWGVGDKGES